MANLFDGCMLSLAVGKFEQVWFVCVLGLFAWTILKLKTGIDSDPTEEPETEKTFTI